MRNYKIAVAGTGLAAVTSSFFAALYSAFGKYDVVHIHAEGPAFFSWLPKMFGKRVVVTIHGEDSFSKESMSQESEISENILLPDLAKQSESIEQQSGEIAERGMPT